MVAARKALTLFLSLTLLAPLVGVAGSSSALAESFFGVLAPQSSAVLVTLSRNTIKQNESASASASGGSGDGAYSFSTSTPAKCSINNTTGSITPIAAGSCSVSATRASSGTFLQRTSAPATLTITTVEGEQVEEQAPQVDKNGNLIAVSKPIFSSEVEMSGAKALVTWKLSATVDVVVTSRKGEAKFKGVARTEEGGVLEIPNLDPGYLYTFTVTNDDGKISQVFQRSVAPTKVMKVSGLSPSKATNYAFVVKWEPQSYVEYYKIEITGDGEQPLIYYSKTPDFYLFNKVAKSYLFAVSAQGEGGDFSDPVRFRAGLTAPINITSNLATNPASNKLTTSTSNNLKAIANRLTAQTVVTVTTYYDPKVKGAKKLATTRIARAAATLKVAKPTLVVKTQVRKLTTQKSLSQITLTTKAPARKLTLSNA